MELKSDNYIKIDIHALSFDLYYADWWGTTQLLANVQDTRLRETYPSKVVVVPPKEEEEEEEEEEKDNGKKISKKASKSSPIWQLNPQESFQTYDYVLMEPIGGLATIINVIYSMIQNYGIIHVQSTGSIHMKADGKIPLTVNILCDNVLNGFTLEMQGLRCDLYKLDMGWKDIPSSMRLMGDTILSH